MSQHLSSAAVVIGALRVNIASMPFSAIIDNRIFSKKSQYLCSIFYSADLVPKQESKMAPTCQRQHEHEQQPFQRSDVNVSRSSSNDAIRDGTGVTFYDIITHTRTSGILQLPGPNQPEQQSSDESE